MQDCQLLIPGFILCSERSIGIDGSLINNGENDWIGLYSVGGILGDEESTIKTLIC